MTPHEAFGSFLMLASMQGCSDERATHLCPINVSRFWPGYVDGATLESQIVQNRSDPLRDAASLSLAGREEHGDLAGDCAIPGSHALMYGKSHAPVMSRIYRRPRLDSSAVRP
jgi:hypothetical protein